MRVSSVIFSRKCKLLRLVYCAAGFSRTGENVDLPIQNLEDGEVMAVGEDACFVAPTSSGYQVFGVADGRRESGLFSKRLMECCYRVVKENTINLRYTSHILQQGYNKLKQVHPNVEGSSTTCILSLDNNSGILKAANLGDCGYLVVRQGKIVGRSTDQVYHFNFPYGLSHVPFGFIDESRQVFSVSPLNSHVTEVPINGGDIILTATNGLFNHMEDDEIIKHINLKDFNFETVKKTARNIVNEAYQRLLDLRQLTPVAKRSSKVYSYNFSGGKESDIIVILGVVVSCDEKT